jgi:hypothetical protein
MPQTKLKVLLASGCLIGDKLTKAVSLCDDWYIAEPSLVTFALRALFHDLKERRWDDGQGIPAAQYAPFQAGVMPILKRIAEILSATPAAEPITQLDDLAVAYRDSIKVTP